MFRSSTILSIRQAATSMYILFKWGNKKIGIKLKSFIGQYEKRCGFIHNREPEVNEYMILNILLLSIINEKRKTSLHADSWRGKYTLKF